MSDKIKLQNEWFLNLLSTNTPFAQELFEVLGKPFTVSNQRSIFELLGSGDLYQIALLAIRTRTLTPDEKSTFTRLAIYRQSRNASLNGTINTNRTATGCTLLHTAAAANASTAIYVLLLYGADKNALNDAGQKPFDMVLNNCRESCGINPFCHHETIRWMFATM